MNYSEALTEALYGKKIRLPHWPATDYLAYPASGPLTVYPSGESARVFKAETLRVDWEILGEKKTVTFDYVSRIAISSLNTAYDESQWTAKEDLLEAFSNALHVAWETTDA